MTCACRNLLDIALTAADRYALSLLPTALQGVSISNPDPLSASAAIPQQRTGHVHQKFNAGKSPAGYGSSLRGGNQFGYSPPAYANGGAGTVTSDARLISSWDAGLRDILAALEPAERSIKPVSGTSAALWDGCPCAFATSPWTHMLRLRHRRSWRATCMQGQNVPRMRSVSCDAKYSCDQRPRWGCSSGVVAPTRPRMRVRPTHPCASQTSQQLARAP